MIFNEIRQKQKVVLELREEIAMSPLGLELTIAQKAIDDSIRFEHVEKMSKLWETLLLGRSGEPFKVTKKETNRVYRLLSFGVQSTMKKGIAQFTFVPEDIKERLTNSAKITSYGAELIMVHSTSNNPQWAIEREIV